MGTMSYKSRRIAFLVFYYNAPGVLPAIVNSYDLIPIFLSILLVFLCILCAHFSLLCKIVGLATFPGG